MSTALTEIPGWYIEFQAALLRQAPRPGEIDQVTAEGWTSNQKGLREKLAGCLLPQASVVPVKPAKPELLLKPVGTVVIPATTVPFVDKDYFKLKRDGGICSSLGDNFTNWFLSGDGKTEDPESEQMLRYHKLRKSSVDGPIITELGGEAKAETTLAEMFSLMEKQKNGEDGVLLDNGFSNIFYIRDKNGVLRAVLVHWRGGGWDVGADSVGSPVRWRGGFQVFSRNLDLEPSESSAPVQV
ncbi:MAG: hypothetical protein WCX70_01740 [Candidatus Paceibacterota bacterium]|jgi:hypothetical protein